MARLKIADLLPGTDYVVQVRALRDGKTSRWSEKFNFTSFEDDGIPTAPTTTWTSVGDAFVATWTPVTLDESGSPVRIDSYELEFTGGAVTKTMSVVAQTGAELTYTLSLEENIAMFNGAKGTVSFRARAVSNKKIKGTWSDTKSTGNTPPAVPTGFEANGIDSGVELSWNANTEDDLAGYIVFYDTDPDVPLTEIAKVFSGNATRTTYYTSTFSAHYFVLVAVDKLGNWSDPATASATPVSPFVVDTTPAGVPDSLAGTLATNANGIGAIANISWALTDPGDLAGFYVRWRKVGDTNWSQIPFQKEDRAGSIPVPEAYSNYEFQIRSVDTSYNMSNWSATTTISAPTNTAPTNVTGLVSTAGKDSITYYWDAVGDSDLKNYEVTFSTSSTFASGNITYLTGTANTLSVGGLDQNTTYYARVRAVDQGGLTSAAWSATDTETTGTFPNSQPSDGQAPAAATAPTVVAGPAGSLYVTWAPVTTNALGAAQLDTVTYEVHLSSTTGFTPSGTTKATEVSGTSALIDLLPGTTNPLVYGTTYYVKIIAKDRDGAAAASGQSSGVPSKVASSDVQSIGADLIVPGTGFVSALIVNSGGSIQSSNYGASAGWKISTTGAEFNGSDTTVKAEAIKAGTLGGASGSGVINIAAGTSLVFNGGYLKSNTYTGTTQATNPSGAGFYLGNDGIRIDQGIVSASALVAGTISGTNTITLSGPNAKIVGTGFSLSGSGLTVASGTIAAAAITVTSAFANDVTATATTIDGGKITTGSIQSQAPWQNGQPLWSLNTQGYMTVQGLTVRGASIVGVSGTTDSVSYLQSGNYAAGTGWRIDGSGNATLNQATVRGTITSGTSNKVEITTTDNPFEAGTTQWGMINFYADSGSGYLPGTIYSHYSGGYGQLNLASPYTSTGKYARLQLQTSGSSTTKATLTADQLELAGNTMALVSSNSSQFDFIVYNTNVYSFRNSGGSRINLSYGFTDNTIASRDSSTNPMRMLILGSDVLLNMNNGSLLFSGGTNIRARLEPNSGTAPSLIFKDGGIGVCSTGMNSSTFSSANTQPFHAADIHSWTGGLYMEDLAGGGATTAGIGNGGRITRATNATYTTSSIKYKTGVETLSLENAKSVLDMRAVTFYDTRDGAAAPRVSGFIAEEAAELGTVDLWVGYHEGEAAGIRYHQLTSAHNVLIKNLYDKNTELEEKNSELESRLERLERLVESLETRLDT